MLWGNDSPFDLQMTSPRLLHQTQRKLAPFLEPRGQQHARREMRGRGIRDLNGVVQLPLRGHGVAPLASHTPAAQGLRKRVGMGKHRRFKS